MLIVVISDTDWDIGSWQFMGGGKKTALPMRMKHRKYTALLGWIYGTISFHFTRSLGNFFSAVYITAINVPNLLICTNEQLRRWHTSWIIYIYVPVLYIWHLWFTSVCLQEQEVSLNINKGSLITVPSCSISMSNTHGVMSSTQRWRSGSGLKLSV